MRLRVTPQADADLDGIWNYIARDSSDAADRVGNDLHAAMNLLAEFPGIGHTRQDVGSSDYRFWRVYSYLIVYRVESDALIVVRVVHGSRAVREELRRLS